MPVPVSMLSDASTEYPPALIWLVIATGRNTFTFPLTTAPGVPVHCRSISPICSARPSEWTRGTAAETTQIVGFWACRPRQKVKKRIIPKDR
jgi:hypothetical protein